MERYDVVIVGAGLNGLVTAAYLARAGKSVAVFEARDSVGGTMSTVEIAPGYRAPAAFDTVETLHPSLSRDLDLAGHGLELIHGGGTFVVEDASTVTVVDPKDRRLAELERFLRKLGGALERVWSKPLPDVEPNGLSGVMDILRLGWALRRMGKKDFPEALRYLPMPLQDVLDEHLEDDVLKAAVAAPALRGAWMGPRSAGSAYGLVHQRPPWAGGLVAPVVLSSGGPGSVTEAVAAAARAAGARINAASLVTRIRIENDRATGLEVNGGLVEAGTVISALDPRTTLLDLVGARWLAPDFVERVRQIRSRGGVTIVRLALDKLPEFPGGAETARGRIQVGASLDNLERAYDAAKYRELPEKPLLTCTIPSALDPSLAPDGHHVMAIQAQFTPYELAAGDWSAERESFGDRVVALLDACAPGLAESVLHRQVESPVDLERRFGLTGGCLHHAELALDQLLYMRPIPGWYGYRMPVEGLYLCGPGTHPGGAGTGLSGKNAATQVLSDLKM
jgi:phytoene dehydrogenase-like protein